jgi:hypothetical protein
MFRSRGDAAKRTIEQDLEKFAAIRDSLFAFAVSNGPLWRRLATDYIPELTGRPLQLWRPILGLARQLSSQDPGLSSIPGAILDHITRICESSPNDSISDAEIVVLRNLWEMIKSEDPTPGQETSGITCEKVRDRAYGREPEVMKKTTAHKVGRILRKFGIRIETGHRHTVDERPAERRIRRVEKEYGASLIPNEGG